MKANLSLVSISEEQMNDSLFMESLATLDPDLWLIKNYLLRYKINPAILPSFIEQLARVNSGSGWGEVKMTLREHRVIKCIGQDDRLLDLEIGETD